MKTIDNIDLEKIYISLCSLTSNFKDGINRQSLNFILINIFRSQGLPLSPILREDVIAIFSKLKLLWMIEKTEKYICFPPENWEEAWSALK